MSRVFLMKWYHFTVEYFEDLRNVNHCEFLIMRKQPDNGKYILENKLRTWSELRRERAALLAKEEKENGGKSKDASKLERQNSIPVAPRKWGGCPEGCNHGKGFKIRRDLLELRQHDEQHANHHFKHPTANGHSHLHGHGHGHGHSTIASRRAAGKQLMPNTSDEESDDPRGRVLEVPPIDVVKARDDGTISSPDGTPYLINIADRLRGAPKTPLPKSTYLHVGRDGGGTYSGHASEEEISDMSEDDARRRLASRAERVKTGERHASSPLTNGSGSSSSGSSIKDSAGNGNGNTNGGGGKHPSIRIAQANRLGDASPNEDGSEDGGDEADPVPKREDLDKAEAEDRSVRGSVY